MGDKARADELDAAEAQGVADGAGTEVAKLEHHGLPTISAPGKGEWDTLWTQAEALARSGVVPAAVRGKPADLMVIFLTGRELQVPPMMALGKIHVIEGKASMSSELMVALVLRAGHAFEYLEQSAQRAAVRVRRRGSDRWSEFEFTMEDATRAGLDKKGTWKSYPRAMLAARVASMACRAMFPDVMMGVSYVPEELGADVDPITGEVISDPEIETISDDDVAAFMARIRDLNETYQNALRETLKERGWIVRRLPVRLKQALDDEIAGLEQWMPKPDAPKDDEPAEAVVVPPVAETTEPEVDDDDVEEAVVVEEAGSAAASAPEAAPASEDVPPGEGVRTPAPTTTLPGQGESPGEQEHPTSDGSREAPENGSGGGDEGVRGSAPSDPPPGPGPAPGVPISTRSQWQKFAIAAKEASLDDDARHALVGIVSNGRTQTAKALSKLECTWAIRTCGEIVAKHVELGMYEPESAEDGDPFLTVLASDELGEKFVETLEKTLLGGE